MADIEIKRAFSEAMVEHEKKQAIIRQKEESKRQLAEDKRAMDLKKALDNQTAQQKIDEERQKEIDKDLKKLLTSNGELRKNASDNTRKVVQELQDEKRQMEINQRFAQENINQLKMSDEKAVDGRSDRLKAIDTQRAVLEKIALDIKNQGGVASENKQFLRKQLEVEREAFALRREQATSRAAKEEIDKEERAMMMKQGSFLQKISAGIGGMRSLMLDKAKAAGGTLMSILKGTLFAGLFILLAKFFNSDMFPKVIDVLTNTILPVMGTIGEFFLNVGKRFFTAFGNIKEDFNTAFGEGDQSFIERVKAFFGMFLEGGIITLGIVGLTTLVFGFAPLKFLFRAVRGFIGAFKSIPTSLNEASKELRRGTRGRRGTPKTKLGKLAQLTKGAAGSAVDTGKSVASKVANTGSKAMSGLKAGAKSGARMLAGAARFIPGAGLAVTAAMGVFDGVNAGVEEFKKSGSIGKAVKEGLAGTVSGLTFGFVDQKTVSGAFDFIGNTFKKGIDKIKSDTMMGVEKMQALLADPVKFDEEVETRKASIKRLQEKIDKGGFRNVGISSADEKQKIRVLQEEINGLRRAQLEQNAKMKSGSGAAPNVNINAPSDNKVTNSTSNTTSSNTTISNPDPIVQMAMT